MVVYYINLPNVMNNRFCKKKKKLVNVNFLMNLQHPLYRNQKIFGTPFIRTIFLMLILATRRKKFYITSHIYPVSTIFEGFPVT